MAGEEWSDRAIDRGAALDREVDRLRAVYRDHAETLSRLAASSPSKQLSRRYQELIVDVNKAIVGLNEVDPAVIARKTGERPVPSPENSTPPHDAPRATATPSADAKRPATQERPILSSYTASAPAEEGDEGTVFRVALIIGLAIVLLLVLALFVWKFSGERAAPAASTAAPAPTTLPAKEEPVTPAPEAKPASLLSVSPEQQDFGTIAKGTNSVRTFEITNQSAKTLTLEVSRSKCRCLWYDPPKSLPPGGRGTLTVRIDGSRAKAGLLSESIEISAKGEREAVAVIAVSADVK